MFKRIGAMIKNAFSGQGSTADMSGATGFCVREELSYREIEQLMRVPLIRNVVECVPDDIVRAWRNFDDADSKKFFDIERKYDLTDKVHEALCMAKMYGGCAVLPIYVGDEALLRSPLGKSEKILGFKVIPQQLIHQSVDSDFYSFNFDQGTKLIHKSRVRLVYGKRRYDYTCNFTNYTNSTYLQLGQSEVDLVCDSFVNMATSDQQLSHLMAKSVVDVRKQRGLMDDAVRASRSPILQAQNDAKQAYLMEAAALASNHQGIVCDMDDESVERLSVASGIGGLAVISDRYQGLFVAASGYPRTKILGEQTQGLSNNGAADLRYYYDKVEQYRTHKLYDLLVWTDSLIELSEGVKFPEWKFGNLWQMTAIEEIDYQNKVADRDVKYNNILGDGVFLEAVIDALSKSKTYDIKISDFGDLNGENPTS